MIKNRENEIIYSKIDEMSIFGLLGLQKCYAEMFWVGQFAEKKMKEGHLIFKVDIREAVKKLSLLKHINGKINISSRLIEVGRKVSNPVS